MKRILLWLQGYVMICVCGRNARRFLTLLAGHGYLLPGTYHGEKIENRNVPQNPETKNAPSPSFCCPEKLYAAIRLSDYRKIGAYARKCHVVPLVCERHGFPFFWQKICFYKMRSIGLCIFVFLLYFLQNFLWVIQIYGNSVHTDEQLLSFLREQGITSGIRIDSVSCEQLESLIRNRYSDIIWVSCEKDGTRLKIQMKESFPYQTAEEIPFEAADLVATKDGVVRKLLVRTGTPMVRIGDEVKAGDVLVSGIRIVRDPYDVELSRSYVVSDADVEIMMHIDDRLVFPMEEDVRVYKEKKKKNYTISAFGMDLLKYKTGIPPTKCDIITSYADLRLFNQLFLPISYSSSTVLSYQTKTMVHTKESMQEKVRKAYLQYLEDCVAEGYEILSEQSMLSFTEDTATLAVRLDVVCRGCRLSEITPEDKMHPTGEEREDSND